MESPTGWTPRTPPPRDEEFALPPRSLNATDPRPTESRWTIRGHDEAPGATGEGAVPAGHTDTRTRHPRTPWHTTPPGGLVRRFRGGPEHPHPLCGTNHIPTFSLAMREAARRTALRHARPADSPVAMAREGTPDGPPSEGAYDRVRGEDRRRTLITGRPRTVPVGGGRSSGSGAPIGSRHRRVPALIPAERAGHGPADLRGSCAGCLEGRGELRNTSPEATAEDRGERRHTRDHRLRVSRGRPMGGRKDERPR